MLNWLQGSESSLTSWYSLSYWSVAPLLWNEKFNCCAHISSPLVHIMSQINPIYTLPNSFYCGKCLSRKAVHNWWQTFRWWRRGWNGGTEVAETTVKRFLCCGFRRTAKTMGQVYQCWWRICPFETYLLTLPRIWVEVLIYWLSLRYEFLKHSGDQT
jgi:hypothetical protein